MRSTKNLSPAEKSRIIEMAWEDRMPFGAIEYQYDLSEQQTIKLMRKELTSSSYKMWRKRVSGRKTKHREKRSSEMTRFVSSNQY